MQELIYLKYNNPLRFINRIENQVFFLLSCLPKRTLIKILIFSALLLTPLFSQQVLETDPILANAFPMEEKENTVFLSQAILLNKQVIPQGSVLRVLYVMPQIGDNEVRQEIIKRQQERVYSRTPSKVQQIESPIITAAKKLATETRWSTVQLFKLKLANQSTPDLKLVYQERPEANPQEVPLSFLHGLFLGEKSGKISILAVERRSATAYAGFLAGDQMIRIGAQKIEGSLSSFLKIYEEEKKNAEATPTRELLFEIIPPGQTTPITRRLKLAISLKTNLLDY